MTWLKYITNTSRNKHRVTIHKKYKWIHSKVTITSTKNSHPLFKRHQLCFIVFHIKQRFGWNDWLFKNVCSIITPNLKIWIKNKAIIQGVNIEYLFYIKNEVYNKECSMNLVLVAIQSVKPRQEWNYKKEYEKNNNLNLI